MQVVGRESIHALYDERFVTFGEDDVYEQADAGGFIRLFALPARVRALKDQELEAQSNVPAPANFVAAGLTGEFEQVKPAVNGRKKSLASV